MSNKKKAGTLAIAVLSALSIATDASAGTCTATCAASDAVIVAPGSVDEGSGNSLQTNAERRQQDDPLPIIRRPGDLRGPGFWTN